MKRNLLKDGFRKDDFDKLRSTLAAHLSEIMPERDHREAILNLIHDVQTVAKDQANAILRECLGEPVRVKCRLDDGKWSCDEHEGFARATHQGYLVCVEKVEGEK